MVKRIGTAVALAVVLTGSAIEPGAARGDHGMEHGMGHAFGGTASGGGRPDGHGIGVHGLHGAANGSFDSGNRHKSDAYVKAASGERDRLLDKQLKSIGRGY